MMHDVPSGSMTWLADLPNAAVRVHMAHMLLSGWDYLAVLAV